MKVNVWNTILQLSKERGVEPRVIIQAIEESLRVASAKFFSQNENVQVLFKPEKGELRVFAVKRVAEKPKNTAEEISLTEARSIRPDVQEGETVEVDLPSDTLGRIAAQAAKQVIFQKVRDAEQEKIISEFAPRIGEIVTGVVRQDRRRASSSSRSTGPKSPSPCARSCPTRRSAAGDLIKAVIIQVLKGYQGPQIIVSRSSPRFLARLLETEIPEIANGTIEIKDIVRQPGERAKVAVASRERDIDPVGACIGVKGQPHPGHLQGAPGREGRHHRLVARSRHLRQGRPQPGQGRPAPGRQPDRKGPAGRRPPGPALAGHRQEGDQRQAGLPARRLENLHQTRRRA